MKFATVLVSILLLILITACEQSPSGAIDYSSSADESRNQFSEFDDKAGLPNECRTNESAHAWYTGSNQGLSLQSPDLRGKLNNQIIQCFYDGYNKGSKIKHASNNLLFMSTLSRPPTR